MQHILRVRFVDAFMSLALKNSLVGNTWDTTQRTYVYYQGFLRTDFEVWVGMWKKQKVLCLGLHLLWGSKNYKKFESTMWVTRKSDWIRGNYVKSMIHKVFKLPAYLSLPEKCYLWMLQLVTINRISFRIM